MKQIKLEKKSFLKAVIALAIALTFVMPGAAAFANVGTVGVTTNLENTDTINIVEDGEGLIDKREVASDTSDVVEDAVLGSGGNIIYVGSGSGNDSTTIQGGIDLAEAGDTVYVYNGIYYEHLIVDKSINLVGESKEGTIIEGDGETDTTKILLVTVDSVNVSSFTIRNGQYGPYFQLSSYSSITNCIVNNIKWGIYLKEGEYNRVSDCISYGNVENGIYVRDYNTIVTNCITYNCKCGIKVTDSRYSIFTNCTSYNNNYGIYIWCNSGDNEIYHNNFFDNSVEDAHAMETWNQIWDNGYPSGGNYYSEYTGVDNYHGPNQDISGSDGIGDTAYLILMANPNNWDYYPLMNPWGTPPEITDVTATPESQSVGRNVNITCTVEDVHNGVKPAIVYITDPSGYQQGFEMTGIDLDYLGNGEYYYNATYSMFGMYRYFIRAENWRDCGNESDVYQFEIEGSDTVPPVTNCTLMGTVGENDWYVSDVEVNLTATDPHPSSGINYTRYKLDENDWVEYTNPFTVTTDGTHTVEYYSVDMAGNNESEPNWENLKSASFKIDKTDPVTTHSLSGTMGNNGWYTSDVVVTLTASDVTSEVNYTMYKLDENNWTEYTNPFTVTTDGSHTVEYYSVDMAGNVESNKSVSFKIDQTSPEIELTVEKQGFRRIWLFTADVRDETSGVNRVEFYYDDELLGTVTEKLYEWEYSGDNGENATAIVYDHAGNSAEDEKPVSYSQSQSSSSTPVQRAFLSNSESTVEPESINEPNERTATNTDSITNEDPEPTLDVGRVFLKGLLFHKLRKGNVNHAMAIRLFYIEFTPTERTSGWVTLNTVVFKDSAYTGRMYEVGAGLFTYVFGFFKGGLEII